MISIIPKSNTSLQKISVFCAVFLCLFFISIFSLFSPGKADDLGATSTGTIVPDFLIQFQNPTYLVDKDIVQDGYMCDYEKDECKVNMKFTDGSGADLSSTFGCYIDMLLESDQKERCNPNTIIFPEGEHDLHIIVYEKDLPSNTKEKYLHISNTPPVVEIPDIDIMVQSGLEQTGTGDTIAWQCKNEDCKVNLTLEHLFTGSYIANNYACTWDFGSGSFTTEGTDVKCNPGYVSYPEGSHQIIATIYDKDIPSNFKTGALDFVNPFVVMPGILPNINLDFQNPTYFTNRDDILSDVFYCDQKKDICKVNLQLLDNALGKISSNYACMLELSFTGAIIEECNPSKWEIPKGEHTVRIQVYEAENRMNFHERIIQIINTEMDDIEEISTSSGGGGTTLASEVEEGIEEIVVQSGLELGGDGNYHCSEERCAINLKYPKSSRDTCFWDFGTTVFKEKYQYTCNPGVVYLEPGTTSISVEVTNTKTNYVQEQRIFVDNRYLEDLKRDNHAPVAQITLQGVMSEAKTLSGNILICEADRCNVNITGKDSFDPDGEKLQVLWNLGNGEISQKLNPPGQWYETGVYTIELTVTDSFGATSIDILQLSVGMQKELTPEVLTRDFRGLKISGVMVNPSGRDDLEYIDIQNTSYLPIDLLGLEVDDVKGKGSKPYVFANNIRIFPFDTYRLYKEESGISLGNTEDAVYLLQGEQIIDEISWSFQIPENTVLTHELLETKTVLAEVVRVIDGDTIEVLLPQGKEKLRLIGVDTPETKHPKKEVEYYGIEAYEFTKTQLTGKKVQIHFEGINHRDKYNRLLGYVYIPGESGSFNETLIREGYARAYLRFPFLYQDSFALLEKQARKEERGMWKDTEVKKLMLAEAREEKKEIVAVSMGNTLSFLETYNFSPFLFPPPLFPEGGSGSTHFLSFSSPWKDTAILSQKSIGVEIKDVPGVRFSQSIEKQKKNLKISGTTEPNVRILLYIGDEEIELQSDEAGKYSYKTHTLAPGEYHIRSEVVTASGGVFMVPREKDVEIDSEYYLQMQSYLVPKAQAAKKEKSGGNQGVGGDRSVVSVIRGEKDVGDTRSLPLSEQLLFLFGIISFGVVLSFGLLKRHKA